MIYISWETLCCKIKLFTFKNKQNTNHFLPNFVEKQVIEVDFLYKPKPIPFSIYISV